MSRNRVKIVCHAQANILSYQFQNEQMAWMPVSQFSELAQRKFTETSIRMSAPEILAVINTVYNPGNRGVDISFEGPDQDYNYLCKVVKEKFSNENISCGKNTIKAAMVGKRGVGKTTLIEALGQKQGVRYAAAPENGYRIYKSSPSTIEWYEVEGIDLGIEYIQKAEHTVDILSKQGLTLFIYCLGSVRVEELELQFIRRVRQSHPEVTALGILTNAGSEDAGAAAERLSKQLGVKVLPVMARDRQTRGGMVKAFGHESILNAIFGGE